MEPLFGDQILVHYSIAIVAPGYLVVIFKYSSSYQEVYRFVKDFLLDENFVIHSQNDKLVA